MNNKDSLYQIYLQGQEFASKALKRENNFEGLENQYWLAGYDNVEFEQFHKFVKESRRETVSNLDYSRIGLKNI